MKIRFVETYEHADYVVIKDKDGTRVGRINKPGRGFRGDGGYWAVYEFVPGYWFLVIGGYRPFRVIARCHTLEEAKTTAIAHWF